MRKLIYRQDSNMRGQTMIETLVAVFILVMGITAAVGLAIYAFGSSSNITKQIIATGLAREGVDAVKNMRDTNWLRATLDYDCYNFASIPPGQLTATCYKSWLNPPSGSSFNLNPPSGEKSYNLSINPNPANLTWNFNIGNGKWGLNLVKDATNPSFAGFYVPELSRFEGDSDYYRKITLTSENVAPFNQISPRLKVLSQVWWADKHCPRSADWPGLGKCSVELTTYLTNWKNY